METQLRQFAAQLEQLSRESPEMTGMDFAAEHGWVSPTELEQAKIVAKQQQVKEQAILEQIRQQLASDPEFLNDTLHQLDHLYEILLPHTADFDVQCVCNLLPSLKKTLAQWQAGEETKYSPAWAWLQLFKTLDQAAAKASLIKSDKNP